MADGQQFGVRIAPVKKRFGDAIVRMLAYNGSIPGPTLRVQQGSELVVNVVNDGDLEATVHWHGLRLENRYDGTADTQQPMPIGGRFTYHLKFPDPGVYWYHPHIREDYGQEMGLYGNIIVIPSEADYWPPVNREITLTLDDILLENGKLAPFSRLEHRHKHSGGADQEHQREQASEKSPQFPSGIEWEDDMVDVNRIYYPDQHALEAYRPTDRCRGRCYRLAVPRGRDRVKVRLVNEMDSDHPMHHPFHIHGAGRFLILARDGAFEPNLVWKDTVLARIIHEFEDKRSLLCYKHVD
jgi:FtsP/CotA-like multicopper oxidase with cupredoxin domain